MPVGPNHFTSLLDCSDGPLIILCTLIFHFFGYHLVRLSTWYLIKTDSENIYTLNQKIIALILYFSHAHHHKVQMIIRGMSGYVYFFNVGLHVPEAGYALTKINGKIGEKYRKLSPIWENWGTFSGGFLNIFSWLVSVRVPCICGYVCATVHWWLVCAVYEYHIRRRGLCTCYLKLMINLSLHEW